MTAYPSFFKCSSSRFIYLFLLNNIHRNRNSSYQRNFFQLSQPCQRDVWGTETASCSAHLSATTNTQVCVHITLRGALRVPVPPSAKLNLLSPFCSRRVGASFQVAPLLSANTDGPRERSKLTLPKAQCNCPVIVHSSTAQSREEEKGGRKSCEHSTSKIL